MNSFFLRREKDEAQDNDDLKKKKIYTISVFNQNKRETKIIFFIFHSSKFILSAIDFTFLHFFWILSEIKAYLITLKPSINF